MTNGLRPVPRISFCRPLNGFELLENGEMQFPNGSSTPYQPHLRPFAKELYKARKLESEAAQGTNSGTMTFSLKIPAPENAPRKVLLETPISPPLPLTGM